MRTEFLGDDFLLQSSVARKLFHTYAKDAPIYDYHCHLPPREIREDRQFENLTQVWLYGDHYKWRAMRANGFAEERITGRASDYEKFEAWAQTVPYTIRNPLYQWTHLELKRYFGVDELLATSSARRIYDTCGEMLRSPEFSVRMLIARMRVRVVCTTDDPTDTLEHHVAMDQDSSLPFKVRPAFRPDKAMGVESEQDFNAYVDQLESAADMAIASYKDLRQALRKRHQAFHDAGCRISDHGVEVPYAGPFTEKQASTVFSKVRAGRKLSPAEIHTFKSAMMFEFAVMDAERGWTFQLHYGALRNNNSRMLARLGRDAGFDAMGDFSAGPALAQYLDGLDRGGCLPKTIVYPLNPQDNAMVVTVGGCFQDDSIPGKIQSGTAWWFNDQKDGMQAQMNTLSAMGLLSCFVGMTTDSRSFLSYPRHEYFRRVLCNLIGEDVENGELPADVAHLGSVVRNICYENAVRYFDLPA